MQADMWIHEAAKLQWDLIVLPGGALGAYIMKDCTKLMDMLHKQKDDGRLVGACGDAPSIVLASMPGFLKEGATCFPQMAFRNKIPKASDNDVVVHDNVVTSQGIGSALVFALMLVELLYDSERADRLAQNMLVDRAKCQYLYFPPALDPRVRMVSENELEVVPAVENEKIGKDEQKMNATSQKESLQLVFGATATTSATTTSSAVPAVPSVATTSDKPGFFFGSATTTSAMTTSIAIPADPYAATTSANKPEFFVGASTTRSATTPKQHPVPLMPKPSFKEGLWSVGEIGHVVRKEKKSKIGRGPDLFQRSKRSCSVCHDKTCRGRGKKIFCPLYKEDG